MKRSCQRQTQGLLLPVRRMISLVPRPSAVSSTISARQTCFCKLFRSAMTASSRSRSPGSSRTSTPLPHPLMIVGQEPQKGIFCIDQTTSLMTWPDPEQPLALCSQVTQNTLERRPVSIVLLPLSKVADVACSLDVMSPLIDGIHHRIIDPYRKQDAPS